MTTVYLVTIVGAGDDEHEAVPQSVHTSLKKAEAYIKAFLKDYVDEDDDDPTWSRDDFDITEFELDETYV